MKEVTNILTNGNGYSSDEYLVIHSTANPGATAQNHLDYWRRILGQWDFSMARYVVDWNQIVYQIAPNNTLLWEVGNGNSRVFGIELCEGKTQAQFDAVWAAATEWAAKTLKAKKKGIDKMISHDTARQWWGGTDHTDPLPYFKRYGRTWQQFVDEVRRKMGTTVKQEPGAAVNDSNIFYTAHVQDLGWCPQVKDGQVAGSTGHSLRLEAVKVDTTKVKGGKLRLGGAAHIQNVGSIDIGELAPDTVIGSEGKGQRIEAIGFYVLENTTGKTAYFRVHQESYGWGAWQKISKACMWLGSTGQGRRLEAVQIKLV